MQRRQAEEPARYLREENLNESSVKPERQRRKLEIRVFRTRQRHRMGRYTRADGMGRRRRWNLPHRGEKMFIAAVRR
jgi:hypothetical protein